MRHGVSLAFSQIQLHNKYIDTWAKEFLSNTFFRCTCAQQHATTFYLWGQMLKKFHSIFMQVHIHHR